MRPTSGPDVDELREIARAGRLADWDATAGRADRERIRAALYAVVWPIVFDQLTRGLELRRGHSVCARGLERLAAECLDRFHDDVEAVLTGVLSRAHGRIENLEAWIASTISSSTVDGHRRRRGQRGALQRPRTPKWLVGLLDADPWLTELAIQILTWVGIPTTAGTELWPVDQWAERRVMFTGDWTGGGPRTVRREIAFVLSAMRTRPRWYADHVERPLGHKQPCVVPGSSATHDGGQNPPPLTLVEQHELDDAHLTSLASAAIDGIEARLRRGEDPRAAVTAVVRRVFCGDLDPSALEIAPHSDPARDEWLLFGMRDLAMVERIVAAALGIIADAAKLAG